MVVSVTCATLEPDFIHSSAVKSESLGVDLNVGEYFLCEMAVHIGEAFSSHSNLTFVALSPPNPHSSP
jgi:hypothetical protein